MFKRIKHSAMRSIAVVVVAGCSTPVVVHQSPVATLPKAYMPDGVSVLNRHNTELFARTSSPVATGYEPDDLPFKDEWKWNRNGTDVPPKVCLALSGGGMRSAALGVGVMRGLAELNVLSNVDVISAVSGGSYALSWYLAHHYHAQQSSGLDPTIFSDDSPAFQHLLSHSRIRTFGASAISAVAGVVGMVPNAIAPSQNDTTVASICLGTYRTHSLNSPLPT